MCEIRKLHTTGKEKKMIIMFKKLWSLDTLVSKKREKKKIILSKLYI